MHLLKYRDVYGELGHPGAGNEHTGLGGEFRLVKYNSMGQMNYDSGWFGNLITNNGLSLCTTWGTSWANVHYIGSGSTAPAFTDTQMESFLAYSQVPQGSPVKVWNSSSPYELHETQTRRFDAGVGTGTVREVGAGQNTAGTNMFAHAAVSPAIVKASDEVLDVSYRLKIWPRISDVGGTVVIDGITYDTVNRALLLNAIMSPFDRYYHDGSFPSYHYTYDGLLGALTANAPLGAPSPDIQGAVVTAGSGGSGFRNYTVDYGLNEGNAPLGVRTAKTRVATDLHWQTQFTAQGTGLRIPKNATKIMTLVYQYTWARHP